MKISDIVSCIISLFISLPIWLFLLYSILKLLQPDRLVWFLYWIYVPTCFINGIVVGIMSKIEEDK